MEISEKGGFIVVRFTGRELLGGRKRFDQKYKFRDRDCPYENDAYEFAVKATKRLMRRGEALGYAGWYKRGEQIIYDVNFHSGVIYEFVLRRVKLPLSKVGRIRDLREVPSVDASLYDLPENDFTRVYLSKYRGSGSKVARDINRLLPCLRNEDYFFQRELYTKAEARKGGYDGRFSLWIDDRKLKSGKTRETPAKMSGYAPRSGFVKRELAKASWDDTRYVRDLLELEDVIISGKEELPDNNRLLRAYKAEYPLILKELDPKAYQKRQKALEKERKWWRVRRLPYRMDSPAAISWWEGEQKEEWLKAGGKP